jgi:hypothetical protein
MLNLFLTTAYFQATIHTQWGCWQLNHSSSIPRCLFQGMDLIYLNLILHAYNASGMGGKKR